MLAKLKIHLGVLIFVLTGLLIFMLVGQACSAKDRKKDPWPYWDLQQFTQLVALVPELYHPRLLSLPPGGQDAWERGEMRIHKGPWDTLDFNNDDKPGIAVLLEVGGQGERGYGAIAYLLVASQIQNHWHRILLQELNSSLQRLDEDKLYTSDKDHRLYNGELVIHQPGGLVFDAKRHIIAVRTGETKRLTKAASITTHFSPNGQIEGESEFGYVIEKEVILPFRWDQNSKTFHQEEPYWFIDPESEDSLKRSGVDPESERVLKR